MIKDILFVLLLIWNMVAGAIGGWTIGAWFGRRLRK